MSLNAWIRPESDAFRLKITPRSLTDVQMDSVRSDAKLNTVQPRNTPHRSAILTSFVGLHPGCWKKTTQNVGSCWCADAGPRQTESVFHTHTHSLTHTRARSCTESDQRRSSRNQRICSLVFHEGNVDKHPFTCSSAAPAISLSLSLSLSLRPSLNDRL